MIFLNGKESGSIQKPAIFQINFPVCGLILGHGLIAGKNRRPSLCPIAGALPRDHRHYDDERKQNHDDLRQSQQIHRGFQKQRVFHQSVAQRSVSFFRKYQAGKIRNVPRFRNQQQEKGNNDKQNGVRDHGDLHLFPLQQPRHDQSHHAVNQFHNSPLIVRLPFVTANEERVYPFKSPVL